MLATDGPVQGDTATVWEKVVPRAAKLLRFGEVCRWNPWWLRWSARTVSITTKTTEGGGASPQAHATIKRPNTQIR
jgi:hypothetical protein